MAVTIFIRLLRHYNTDGSEFSVVVMSFRVVAGFIIISSDLFLKMLLEVSFELAIPLTDISSEQL